MKTITDIIIVLLVFVDVAALSIGISIRRKVTRIVRDTAAEIETAVKTGIAEAVANFAQLARAVLTAQGKPTELVDQADRLLEDLRR